VDRKVLEVQEEVVQLHAQLLVLDFTEQLTQAEVAEGWVIQSLVLLLEQVALELLSLAKQQ
tara:strand:+ start:477 stop:659 length:183 start_codon:yes stop_codon:yes gene_type:complete